ncbi:hypothetical protein J1792_30600 [Streptomyces triculaminicus]|uniref:Uncharacterized protein n=2 Tax=Streptomyces TaxID=1883 RepID=A0A939FT72_9ACTN|nr:MULTISPECIES: hypothetical protein [Streptomyces]MBO0656934.1 hypothetical protein [Streptomyces triculaminicus]QSY47654.1 hypothetical protein J3S04_20495 [Streptomyces griseocarneus]
MTPQVRLLELIDRFLAGRDRSMRLVNEIEDILVVDFMDTDVFETLTEAVSLYRPGAGAPYVSEDEMAEVLASARGLLT